MDILADKPVYSRNTEKSKSDSESVFQELPSYLGWLEAGKDGRPFLQALLVRVLATQLKSGKAAAACWWSYKRVTPWISLAPQIVFLVLDVARTNILSTLAQCRTQIRESQIWADGQIKMPRHIGFVMDGNRRYARQLGQPVLMGHAKGAQTAANILEWWLRFIPNTASNAHPGPQYMTVWAFSAENFKRSEHELEGLFRLMTAEFRSLAFTSIVHLFRIRIRIIGNRTGLPFELLETIEMLEEITSSYDKLFLQIAVGYGGRDEIVQSVKRVLEKGDEVTEKNISAETFCSRVAIPPVELIVRTSERRTSGFFLWDTQGAELHFINKLWPELNEGDWLDAIASFAKREMRWGM